MGPISWGNQTILIKCMVVLRDFCLIKTLGLKLPVIFSMTRSYVVHPFAPPQVLAGGTASEEASNPQPVPARKELFAPPPRAEARCLSG